MRIAYIDCLGGASGDMLLGALLDAGLPLDELVRPLRTLRLPGWSLEAAAAVRGHLRATQVRVQTESGSRPQARGLKEIENILRSSRLPQAVIERALAVFQRLGAVESKIHQIPLEDVHFHEIGAIDTIIDVTGTVLGFYLLGIEKIYFSALPVGKGAIKCAHGILPNPAPATLELCKGVPLYGIDAEGELVTPTGAALLTTLGEYAPVFPPLRLAAVGCGAGSRDHPFPNLLRLCIGETIFDAMRNPSAEPENAHFAGSRRHDLHGNTLDPSCGISCDASPKDSPALSPDSCHGYHAAAARNSGRAPFSAPFAAPFAAPLSAPASAPGSPLALEEQYVIILETVIDDLNPERIPFLCEQLLKAGALDAWYRPAQMKKGRPGQEIVAIAAPPSFSRLLQVFFRESTTLGVRIRPEYRCVLPRRSEEIATPLGPVKIKRAFWPAPDGNWHARIKPEFEACKELAEKHHLPLEEVYAVVKEALKELGPENS